MPVPEDPQELKLVRKAITLNTVDGCLQWDEKAEKRLQDRPPIPDLLPNGVRELLIEFVEAGGTIRQVEETRDNWQDRRSYWYKVKIPYEGLPKGLFVEFWLVDDDPDFPSVELVNYHK